MKVFKASILIFIILMVSGVSIAQQLKENEIVVIRGEKFVLHEVRTGETVYSITRNFKTDSLTLVENNPDIVDGLKIGDILKIPYNKNVNLKQKPVYLKGDPSHFDFHTIESRKETPYFIAKKYGITVEEIYAYNPEVKRFKKRQKIRIPRWADQQKNISEKIETQKPQQEITLKSDLLVHKVLPGETLYSISKKYNVSESEILFFNPDAKNLKAGSEIYLPKQNNETTAQVEVNLKEENLENYFEHLIESGQTMYGTTRKYGVSVGELKELNPVLETGFPAGVIIRIPVKEVSETQAKPVNDDAFQKHLVEKGETLYGLSAKYDLKIPEIKKYNPVLEKRNLVFGETILIPLKQKEKIAQFIEVNNVDSVRFLNEYYKVEVPLEIPEACKPGDFGIFANQTFTVALFLPFFAEANDTLNKQTEMLDLVDSLEINLVEEPDTLIVKEEPEDLFKGFYRNSENFLQFYEGVLLAIDSLQSVGMKINLNVFDTQESADSIRKFIYSEDFLETDLIIGPVYGNVQTEVAAIAAKNRIPLVSPLASQSDEIRSNPYFYQVNPVRGYLVDETAELVADEYFNSNFIVFSTGDYKGTSEERLLNLIKEKFYNSGFLSHLNGVSFSVYDFKTEGPFGFRSILSHEKENVVFIPSSNEGELSVAISNINNLASEYSITLVGSNRYQQFRSIDVEHFHNLKLKYIAPYWTEYKKPSTISYFKKFKNNFYTEPNSFGMQGYDVAFYFLSALKNYGRDFNECLPFMNVDLIQGNYSFEKVSQFGGFMNQGVSVISYEPNYEVVRKRVKGQAKFAQK